MSSKSKLFTSTFLLPIYVTVLLSFLIFFLSSNVLMYFSSKEILQSGFSYNLFDYLCSAPQAQVIQHLWLEDVVGRNEKKGNWSVREN